jgi:hypothetical protein
MFDAANANALNLLVRVATYPVFGPEYTVLVDKKILVSETETITLHFSY